jgi:hypothetical protein
MKIAVLANEKDSFVRPLAEGLARMATSCGADPEIHYDGLEILSLPLGMRWRSPRAVASSALKAPGYRKRFSALVERLRHADLIVVVAHVPGSLSRHTLGNVEALRERLPDIPIVNYDLVYLPTVEKWGAAMLRGDLSDISAEEMRLISPPPFGLERYDWYLVASVVSEVAMPSGPHPCSHIGMDIDDGTLFPDQDEALHVLVDFEQTRKDYSSYREIQLAALERSGTSFEVLEGRFTRSEIRKKYRKAGALMLAHRESFGLPIVELQACGGLIFTPKAEWAGAHWIKDDLSVAGHGEHTSNFIVYENTVDDLVAELEEAKRSFDPAQRRKTFRREHPHFFHGDREVLGDFLDRVKSGKIHSKLHLEHAGIGRDG